MFVTGVCMFICAPISGKLMTKIDPRFMIAVGFTGFAVGTWMASQITQDWDFWELLWPQIFRGFGLMLCMVPINNLALGTMPPQKMKNASGVFNLTRNLGGAFGLALINTILDKRMDLHIERLHDSVAWGRSAADEAMATMTGAFSSLGSDAQTAAIKQMTRMAHRQAEILALGDVFLSLTVLFLALVGLTLVMRKPAARPGPGGGGH
jgi:DHA2 family multidrug resistance protein